jgi:hypothetical protein
MEQIEAQKILAKMMEGYEKTVQRLEEEIQEFSGLSFLQGTGYDAMITAETCQGCIESRRKKILSVKEKIEALKTFL